MVPPNGRTLHKADRRTLKEADRRTLLKVVGTAGIGLLAGCAGFPDGDADAPTDRQTDDRTQPLSYGVGGGSCLPDPESVESGWIHTVAHGESYDVTFDALLAHDVFEEASVSLTNTSTDHYELRFSAGDSETDPEKTPRDAGCTYGSRVSGGGSVPTDFATLRAVAGVETVTTIEREGTGPRLHRLPSPMRL